MTKPRSYSKLSKDGLKKGKNNSSHKRRKGTISDDKANSLHKANTTGDQPVLHDDVMSSDDDGPDDVAFDVGKKSALQRMRDVMQQIEADKLKQRAKRRQLDVTYQLQKKQKLAELDKCRLPDDVLQSVSSSMTSPAIAVTLGTSQLAGKSTSHSDNTQSCATLQKPPPSHPQHARVSDESDDSAEDEPIKKTGGMNAVCIKEMTTKSTSSVAKAIEFRNGRLYGSAVRREPVTASLARSAKRKVLHNR